jgi:hypothetical protein
MLYLLRVRRQTLSSSLHVAQSINYRLFGFLFGCTLSGAAVYNYLLQEYKAANDLLTEDIYVRFPSSSIVADLPAQIVTCKHATGPLPELFRIEAYVS